MMAKKTQNEWPELLNNKELFLAKIRELYSRWDMKPAARCWADENRCCPLTLVGADYLKSEPHKMAFLDLPHVVMYALNVERDWVQSFTDEIDGFEQKESVSNAIKLAKFLKENLYVSVNEN